MIKAIIWDMGGVLISEEAALESRVKWERQLGLAAGGLAKLVFYHPITPRLFVGESPPEEMWRAVGEELKLSSEDLEELSRDFWGEPDWNNELLEYIRSLKGHYKLGVLSNAWVTTRQTVRAHINSELFDVIMFSAEEGMCKPDLRIYQRILSRLEVGAGEAIFVDDRIPYVEGAEQVGINCIHYTKETDVRGRINKIIETT